MIVAIFMQGWWLDHAGIPISKFLVKTNYPERIAPVRATDDACRLQSFNAQPTRLPLQFH